MGDRITYAMLVGVYVLSGVAGGIADNSTVTLVGTIAIGVPATFVQALLRHAWNERRRRRRGAAYDAPSTRRT